MDELRFLPIDRLSVNPLRIRQSLPRDSLLELADSIRNHGVLVPLLVGLTPAGFQIICGERRWRAAKIAGLTQLPCLIKKVSPQEMLLLSLVENVQREALNPLEQAATIRRLLQEYKIPLSMIAESLGARQEELEDQLKLLSLPDRVKEAVIRGKISEEEAFHLTKFKGYSEMIEEFERLIQ